MNKKTYIISVLVVFGLLTISRIVPLINGELDGITIVSMIVEVTFLIWGVLVLRKDKT